MPAACMILIVFVLFAMAIPSLFVFAMIACIVALAAHACYSLSVIPFKMTKRYMSDANPKEKPAPPKR